MQKFIDKWDQIMPDVNARISTKDNNFGELGDGVYAKNSQGGISRYCSCNQEGRCGDQPSRTSS
eukprot:10206519-Prorocentrum_lima.AAC.1